MTDDEKYLFDLNGYLIVEDVLSPDELARANDAIDRRAHLIGHSPHSLAEGSETLRGQRTRGEIGGMLDWPAPDGPLFRHILGHPRLVPYLHEILGLGFRMDHAMFLLSMDEGTEGFYLHGAGGENFDPNEYYIHKNGRFYCGLTVVSIQLHDVNPGDGGLVVVPGSHKANFNAPKSLLLYQRYQEYVKHLSCRAGSAVIFTEAITHGTLPWRGKQTRRSLLTRYNRAGMSYAPPKPPPTVIEDAVRPIFELPYHPRMNRPKLPPH